MQAGFSMEIANSLASRVTKKIRAKEKSDYIKNVKKQLNEFGLI